MYSLLIVEDERWEREGLVNLIDRQKFGIERILIASDGIEGLNIIQAQRPEIIITDIRMPGLTGLEMLENAGKAIEDSACIILSGYGEFNYAQKALRIGVLDFLVKPIEEEEICSVLARVIGMLSQRQHPAENSSELFRGELSDEALREALGGVELDNLRVAALIREQTATNLPPFHMEEDGVVLCYLRPRDHLQEGSVKHCGITKLEGAVDVCAAVQRAKLALENAMFRQLSVPVHFSDMVREKKDHALQNRIERIALEQAVASLDEVRIHDALRGVCARMKADLRIDRKTALQELEALIGEEYAEFSEEILSEQTLYGMLNVAEAQLIAYMHNVRRSLSESERYVLSRVITLVTENYSNADLNLQSVAGQVFLSPNYVGALFKHSTGISFSDYLCRHRLMSAASMLMDHGMRVSAVAEAVGIPNVSYFCVQFRSAYGITPGNFRKKQS